MGSEKFIYSRLSINLLDSMVIAIPGAESNFI